MASSVDREYSATITTRHSDNYNATLGARGARFIASVVGGILPDGVERERVELLEVKGNEEHPAKGFDGSRRDRRRDAASGLLGSGRWPWLR